MSKFNELYKKLLDEAKAEKGTSGEPKKIEDAKPKDYLQLKPDGKMYILDYFDDESGKYCITDADDMNKFRMIKKGTTVYLDATY